VAKSVTAVGASGGGSTLLLDQYPGAAAAYSLRKLRAGYSGAAIRVRRSSDSAEQDIGFTSSGDLDETALTTFVGAGDGFVVTWYDQQNSAGLTQSTTTLQPKVVSSGSVVKVGGQPGIEFSNDYLLTTALNSVPTSDFSVFQVTNTPASTQTAVCCAWNGVDDLAFYPYINASVVGSRVFWRNLGSLTEVNSGDISSTKILQAAIHNKSSSFVKIYRNTAEVVDLATSGTAGSFSNFTMHNTNSNTAGLNTPCHELVIYAADKTGDKTGIESNVNDYWSIY
jgi:hypothetical protein